MSANQSSSSSSTPVDVEPSSSLKRSINPYFFKFSIQQPEDANAPKMTLEELETILEYSVALKYRPMKIEKTNNVEEYIIASLPIYVSAAKLKKKITDNFPNTNVTSYIDIEKVDDFIPKEVEEIANKMRKKFGETEQVNFCEVCDLTFNTQQQLRHHRSTRSHLIKDIEQSKDVEENDFFVLKGKAAFKNRISTIIFLNKNSEFSVNDFCEKIKYSFSNCLESHLKQSASVKVNCNLFAYYKKISGEEKLFNLNTYNVTFFKNDNILNKIEMHIFPQFDVQNDDLNSGGSGWMYNSTSELEVRICKNDILKTAGTYIKTPPFLEKKKALINIQNKDSKCFYYCIFTKFVKTHPHLVKSYKHIEWKLSCKKNIKFDFSRVNFPATLRDIKMFEKYNDNVSVNVYVFERKKISPLKVCDTEKLYHYDLLLLKRSTTFHYVYINNFSRLISSQLTRGKRSVEVCKRCLFKYAGKNSKIRLLEHKRFCNDKFINSPSRVELPYENNNILTFKNFKFETPVTYIAFADFECMLKPINSRTNVSGNSNTRQLQEHVPIAFCFYIVHADEVNAIKHNGKIRKPKNPVCYVGPNAADIFFDMIKKVALKIQRKYVRYLHLDESALTLLDKLRFKSEKNCCICRLKFNPDELKVRHHSHITGKFIGPAHSKCNILNSVPTFLPIFLHNLSRYDSHLILRGFKKGTEEMRVLPHTEETYITFSKKIAPRFWLKFVDSYRFLSASLRSLVDILPQNNLIHTKLYFAKTNHFELITQKGFFCYDYLDCLSKLDQTNLPSKEQFYNKLNDESISDDDYKFIENVWKTFECRNLKDYLTIYVISDCLLLADVFLSFRKISLQNYGLDPCYFISLPSYSFEAMLKVTKVEFEQLTDIDMFLFFEEALRGGITNTVIRYAEANNIHVPETYNPEKPPSTIFYTDCNNLYGWSMAYNNLPLKNFKWIKEKEKLEKFSNPRYIFNLHDESDKGYYLEVDLEYPEKYHDSHNAFPFAPERKKPPNSKISKLLCTLENKNNYVCHYRNLKLCLKNGLVLKKVHRVLEFSQTNYLKLYVDLNTTLRQRATSDFDVNFYKLMNNSMFGKLMERERNYMNFKLVCSGKSFSTSVSKPTFKNTVIFSKNLVGVHFYKAVTRLTKPIYAGVTVLELSRNYMYKFYYEDLGKIFHDIDFPQLLYMDTDSFILNVKTFDIYPYIKNNLQFFDTSNFPSDHDCFSTENKKIPGFFKDELVLRQCIKYISLSPKVYSMKLTQNEEIKKIKGIKKSVVKKEINFDDFYSCLFENRIVKTKQINFQSKKHKILTIEQNKVALNAFADKRNYFDNINSYAFGHYNTLENVSSTTRCDNDSDNE